MTVLELMKERYSVRAFKPDNIEEDKLEQILKAGQIAPTACNNQPQHIYVVKSDEAMEKLKPHASNLYGAPVVLLCCADIDKTWKSPKETGYNTGEMDVSIVVTHMMLEAWELGIGSVWVRAFDVEKIKEVFNLPHSMQPVCLLPLGYKTDNCTPAPLHEKKKEIGELVTYL